jgi:hypothetical protein
LEVNLLYTALPKFYKRTLEKHPTTIKLYLKQVFQRAYRHELELKLARKPWRQEIANTPDWPKERKLQNSEYASDMTAWVHIFTASESTPTLSACYAASANPWTETIWDNVPHWLVGHTVSDPGRLGQK